jgi:NADPH-dependent 2,4-dienoyl-CoA reductase/sulfur reductase-like enzyme
VIVGIGVSPATDFVKGIPLAEDGSIPVDGRLSAAEGVYAAGDIAQFPYMQLADKARIEHWVVAEQQGRVAAMNMADLNVQYDFIPFFWTVQYDVYVMVTGYAAGWDEILVQGNIVEKDFVALYVQGDQVIAAAGVGHDRDIAAISELLRLNRMPSADELRSRSVDFVSRL